MKKRDRIAMARVDIAYLRVEHGDAPPGMRVGGIDLSVYHLSVHRLSIHHCEHLAGKIVRNFRIVPKPLFVSPGGANSKTFRDGEAICRARSGVARQRAGL